MFSVTASEEDKSSRREGELRLKSFTDVPLIESVEKKSFAWKKASKRYGKTRETR